MLAPPLVFPQVTTELMAIICEEPIDISLTECARLLDLPGQVVPKSLRHPPLILCVLDVNDEAEMQFMQPRGVVGLFEMCIDENRGKQGWLDNTLVTLCLRLDFLIKEARRPCIY
jgi:hypothetical protein